MQYKLVLEEDINLQSLRERIKQGGKFIVFSYCISLFAITLKRMSPAIFIENETQFRKYKRYYNGINLLFGWWGIPWGLFYTPNYIRANNKGGIDVTEDVLLNVTDESLKEKRMEFLHTSMLFDYPSKSDEKIFLKQFNIIISKLQEIDTLAVGWYLNVENGYAPFYLIGISSSDYYANYETEIKKHLYQDFYKHVPFQFINLSEQGTLVTHLLKQGLVVKRHHNKD
jgi:hypothetical protein